MAKEKTAAWYEDPAGRGFDMRYWSGAAWTDHVTKGGEQLVDPAGSYVEPVRQALAVNTKGLIASREAHAVDGTGALLQVRSHDEGRNAMVTLYPDRIERVKAKALGALSRARQDTEVIPIKAVSSVQAKKSGLRTNVTVFASGNNLEFRLGHDDAQRFKDAIMRLVLAGPPVPSRAPAPAAAVAPSLAVQIKELAELRDAGLLTEDEFSAQKAKLLE